VSAVGADPPQPPPSVAVARPAATVVLARDAARGEGIEVFLVQRHAAMRFMGGMHVFPGGKVAGDDGSAAMRARVIDAHLAARDDAWGSGVEVGAALTRAVAAIRETLEEAGVLLGTERALPELEDARRRLHAGHAFADVLAALNVGLRIAHLQPLSRWITPESEPMRFDTSFYLARAPLDQQAACDERESVAALWIAPSAALKAAQHNEIRLAPPTAATLQALSTASSVEAALADAARQTVPVILPIIRRVGDDLMVLYPGDPEHPMPGPSLAGPTRRVLRKA
jgi:8-oxo-dGTP pyrophosphatase MutT (NUDIX family)